MAASSAGTIRTSASKRTVATRFSAARANIAVEETWLFFNDQFALHPTVMDSTENRAFELMSTPRAGPQSASASCVPPGFFHLESLIYPDARSTTGLHRSDESCANRSLLRSCGNDVSLLMDSTTRLGATSHPLTLNSWLTPPATPIKCEKSAGDKRKRDKTFAPNFGWDANQSTL